MLSKVTEKKTVTIPPCKIEKELIKSIGSLLEADECCKERVTYSLDSKTRSIESKKVDDFVKFDWGQDINSIEIETDYKIPKVRISIDFDSTNLSSFSVSGENPIWVNGLSDQIESLFQKFKQSQSKIRTNRLIKIPLALTFSIMLTYPLLLVFSPFIRPDSLEEYYAGFGFISVFLMTWAMTELINWLFPYYEYGQTTQAKARKWIWFVLVGLGIIPSIILRLLGL